MQFAGTVGDLRYTIVVDSINEVIDREDVVNEIDKNYGNKDPDPNGCCGSRVHGTWVSGLC